MRHASESTPLNRACSTGGEIGGQRDSLRDFVMVSTSLGIGKPQKGVLGGGQELEQTATVWWDLGPLLQ